MPEGRSLNISRAVNGVYVNCRRYECIRKSRLKLPDRPTPPKSLAITYVTSASKKNVTSTAKIVVARLVATSFRDENPPEIRLVSTCKPVAIARLIQTLG